MDRRALESMWLPQRCRLVLSFRHELMAPVDSRDPRDGAALVIEDLVRYLLCHTKVRHTRDNCAAQIMQCSTTHTRDAIKPYLGL